MKPYRTARLHGTSIRPPAMRRRVSSAAPESDAAPCTSFDVELLVAAAATGGNWHRAQAILVGAARLGVHPTWRAYTVAAEGACERGWEAALSFLCGLQRDPCHPTTALSRVAFTRLAHNAAQSANAARFLQEASVRWGTRHVADAAGIKTVVARCVQVARDEARPKPPGSSSAVSPATTRRSAWLDALRLAPAAIAAGSLTPDVVSLFLEAASLRPPGEQGPGPWEAALRLATLQRHMGLAQRLGSDSGSGNAATAEPAVTPLSGTDLRFALRAAAHGGWAEGLQLLRVASGDGPLSQTGDGRSTGVAGAAAALLMQSGTMWAEGVRCALGALKSTADEDAIRCLQSFVVAHPARGLERSLLHAIHAAPRPTTAPALAAACDCVTAAVQGDHTTWHYALNLLLHPKRGLAASQASYVSNAAPEMVRCVAALSDAFPKDASNLDARMEATVSALCTPALALTRGAPMGNEDAANPTEVLVCHLLQSAMNWDDVAAIQRRFRRTCRTSRTVGLCLLAMWGRLGGRDEAVLARLLNEAEGISSAPPRTSAEVLFAALLPHLSSSRQDVRENARGRVRLLLKQLHSTDVGSAGALSLRVTEESLPLWAGIAAAAADSAALRLVRDATSVGVRDAAALTAVHAAAVGRDLKLAAAVGAYISDAAAAASAKEGPLLPLIAITAAAQAAGPTVQEIGELEDGILEVARRVGGGQYSLDQPSKVLPLSKSTTEEGEGLPIETYAMRRAFIYAFSRVFLAAASMLRATPDAALRYTEHSMWLEAVLEAAPALRSKLFTLTPHKPVATFDAAAVVMLNVVAGADIHAGHLLADAMLRRWACGAGCWVWVFRMSNLSPAARAAIIGACARLVRDTSADTIKPRMVEELLSFASSDAAANGRHGAAIASVFESVINWAATHGVFAPGVGAAVFACVASVSTEAAASVARRVVANLHMVAPSARSSVATTCLGDPRTAEWLCAHADVGSQSGAWWNSARNPEVLASDATSVRVRLGVHSADPGSQPEEFRRRWRKHMPAILLEGPRGWRDALAALPLSVAPQSLRTVLAPADVHPVLSAVAASGDWKSAAAALAWASAHAPSAASSVTGAVECLDVLAADGRLDEVAAYVRGTGLAPSERALRAIATAATHAVGRGRPVTRSALEWLQRTNRQLNDDAVARVVDDMQASTPSPGRTCSVTAIPHAAESADAAVQLPTVRTPHGPPAHIWTNTRKLRLAHHVPYLLAHAPAVPHQPPLRLSAEDATRYAKFLEPFAVVAAALGPPVEARHVAGIWYRQGGASRAHLMRLYHDRIDTTSGARLAEQLGGWQAALAHFLPHVEPLRAALSNLDPDARRAGIDAVMRTVASQASRTGTDALSRPFAPHVLFRHLRPILRPILLQRTGHRRHAAAGDAPQPSPPALNEPIPVGDAPRLALDVGRMSLRAGDKFNRTESGRQQGAIDDAAVLSDALAAIGAAVESDPGLWREALRGLEAEARRRVPGCGVDELHHISQSWWHRALALVKGGKH